MMAPALCALRRLALVALLATTALADSFGDGADRSKAVAVIVHAKNAVPDPTLDEVRAIFALDREHWPDGRPIVLLLRPSGSTEKEVLLEKVYRMSESQLRRHFARKLYAGEIKEIPSVVPTAERAVEAVRGCEGAVSAVLATEVPKEVRVLAIDGKRPGEKGYPLFAKEAAR